MCGTSDTNSDSSVVRSSAVSKVEDTVLCDSVWNRGFSQGRKSWFRDKRSASIPAEILSQGCGLLKMPQIGSSLLHFGHSSPVRKGNQELRRVPGEECPSFGSPC